MQKSQEEFQSLREQAELGDTAAYYDLAARYSTGDGVDADPEKAKKYARLLYSQALLMADLPLENPTEYTDLVCSLMQ